MHFIYLLWEGVVGRGGGGGEAGPWDGRKSQFTPLHETLARDKSGTEH